jgi:hypothetical protein
MFSFLVSIQHRNFHPHPHPHQRLESVVSLLILFLITRKVCEITSFARTFLYIVVKTMVLSNGHVCTAADTCACSPTSYSFSVSTETVLCPTSTNPPSGSGIANVTCEGNRDSFDPPLGSVKITITETSTKGSLNAQTLEVDRLSSLTSFVVFSVITSSVIPKRFEFWTQGIDNSLNPIDTKITVEYTNACTGEPALEVEVAQQFGLFILVRNHLFIIWWQFSCHLSLTIEFYFPSLRWSSSACF